MTIQEPISKSLHDAHAEAVNDINRWRGYCLDRYSRAEAGLRQAIGVMRDHPDGARLKRPSLFGQHVEVMTAAVALDGPFAGPGSKVRDALAKCANGFTHRNIVTHAVGSVWLDRHGSWLWHYEFHPAGKGKPVLTGTLTQLEAKQLERELKSTFQSLDSHLQSFIKALHPAAKP